MPTVRQQLVVDKLTENHGNVSKTMRDVGYSPNTAKKPSNLTKSKGWQQLMKKYLPDSHLGKKHREFLDAKRILRTYKKGDLEMETEETDPAAIRALDLAYKIKGKYSNDDTSNKTLIINITAETADRFGLLPK